MTIKSSAPSKQRRVPVVSSTGKPLMPCKPARARRFIQRGRAVKRWKNGLFYIQLLDREDGITQPTVLGIDPGSKMEGYTVKSANCTFINIQSHARDGKPIKKAIETRASARRFRRYRKTPCRSPRFDNRKRQGWIPPSTLARWQLKLNILKWLVQLYPITTVVIEDVNAVTKKGSYKWNQNFSPVQAGKNWLYNQIVSLGYTLFKVTGHITSYLRGQYGLHKSSNKLSTIFNAHCVDSWVLANFITGGHTKPDLTEVIVLKPLSFCRRQLHRFNPSKGGERARYGGTMSLGLKRGTIVDHPKYGKCLVGGNNGIDRISLHDMFSGMRLCQNAKIIECKKIAYSPYVLLGVQNNPIIKNHNRTFRIIRAAENFIIKNRDLCNLSQGANYVSH